MSSNKDEVILERSFSYAILASKNFRVRVPSTKILHHFSTENTGLFYFVLNPRYLQKSAILDQLGTELFLGQPTKLILIYPDSLP